MHIYYGLFQRRPQGLWRRHCSDEFSLVIYLSFRIRIPSPRSLHYDGALSHGHTPNCSVGRICKFIPFLSRLSARPTDAFLRTVKIALVRAANGWSRSDEEFVEHDRARKSRLPAAILVYAILPFSFMIRSPTTRISYVLFRQLPQQKPLL